VAPIGFRLYDQICAADETGSLQPGGTSERNSIGTCTELGAEHLRLRAKNCWVPLLAIHLAMAITCGWFLLGASDVWKYCYAIPVRDLWGVAVWAAGLFSQTVVWRDQQLTLDADGTIVSSARLL